MTLKSPKTNAVLGMLLGVLATAALAQEQLIGLSAWKIRGTAAQSRWIEVHHIEPWNGGQLFHVEVLGRRNGDPSWRIIHLVPHLAITEPALRRSVSRRSRERAVYPETFDGAYAQWKRLNADGRAPICDVSVEDCMRP